MIQVHVHALVAEDGSDINSDEETEGMCAPGEHKWAHNSCLVCRFCGYCTGYGPGCCNEGEQGRSPGK